MAHRNGKHNIGEWNNNNNKEGEVSPRLPSSRTPTHQLSLKHCSIRTFFSIAIIVNTFTRNHRKCVHINVWNYNNDICFISSHIEDWWRRKRIECALLPDCCRFAYLYGWLNRENSMNVAVWLNKFNSNREKNKEESLHIEIETEAAFWKSEMNIQLH